MRRAPGKNLVLLSAVLAACVHAEERSDSSAGALLPNDRIFELDRDTTRFEKVGSYFATEGRALTVDLANFHPVWPLHDTKTAVLNRQGTPIAFAEYGYFHSGFAVVRSEPGGSDEVLAPHAGEAVVFDWLGQKMDGPDNPYATVVAIYDPVSHLVTQLMHVAPEPALFAAGPVHVQEGAVIGHLARAPLEGANALRYASTQVTFLDAERRELVDPARVFAAYADTTPPSALGVYVADEQRRVGREFRSGKVDLVIETLDRDEGSGRNLEVAAIAYTAVDQDDTILARQERCDLTGLWSRLPARGNAPSRTTDLVDFGSAEDQMLGAWPQSDVGNPERIFRYALTHLGIDEAGRCTVLPDADAFVDVKDSVKEITVHVSLWDAKGHFGNGVFVLARGPNAPPPSDAGADAPSEAAP
jgi:hypothetical protein